MKAQEAGIDIAISTVDRPKGYIHKLMAQLPSDLPVRLIVGSPVYSYLTRYRRRTATEIVGVDLSEWNQLKNSSVLHRASWNYWRCFVYGARSSNSKGLLILEDDVLPAKGWKDKMLEAIALIESVYGAEFSLSLYTAYSKLAKPKKPNIAYRPYPVLMFGGTQAMYYSEPIRAAFAEYLRREGVDKIRLPYDYLFREYLTQTGTPLFVTTPCLFQHIGAVTTGLSHIFHHAPAFSKKHQGSEPRASR